MRVWTAFAVLVLVGACAIVAAALAPDMVPGGGGQGLTRFQFLRQDLMLVPLVGLFALGLVRYGTSTAIAGRPGWCAVLLAVSLVLLCRLGHSVVFADFDLSRDEQMAGFDAAIYARGAVFWPIPPAWRGQAEALNLLFMLPIGDHAGWVSSYLPVNAVLRAIIGWTDDPALTSPLLAAVGAVALWRIAARLWPQSPSTQLVVLLLFAGSSQVWAMAMTAYAMTGHLALNLVWLALFLRGGRMGHSGAIAVGFLAVGLHQIVFHPLFVLPFLHILMSERRWRLLMGYGVAYTAIIAFWLAWPLWVSGLAGVVPSSVNAEGIGLFDRLTRLVPGVNPDGFGLMAANIVRFVTWQHLLLIPLAILGTRAMWPRVPLVRALAVGMILPVGAMLVLLPYQGHGWGYRYLHGLIGSACLLGGYGWRALEDEGRASARAVIAATIVSLGVAVPVHLTMAHNIVAPYAQVAKSIRAIDADVVVIDDRAAPFAQDLVLNRPDLSNRPILLRSSALTPEQAAALCHARKVVFLDPNALKPLADVFGARVSPGYACAASTTAAAMTGQR